jgi:multiple sugar transport system permease protein
MIIIKKDVFKRRSWFGRNPHLVCILPSVIIMGLLVIIPTVFLYYLSLTNYELGSNWSNVKMVGFANFKRLFSGRDPEFWNSIKLSVVFMVIATSLEQGIQV